MRFLEALDKMRNLQEDNEDQAITAIYTGLSVAEDFWDNFIMVCNNKDGMAALLNVSPEKIISWSSSIQQLLNKAKNNPEEKEKAEVLDTGEREEQ